jgi:hypothetical protein
MRRGTAQIHCHVEHRAAHHPHQLALRRVELVMQPAQHALRRARMVVLHEIQVQPQCGEGLAVPAFHEEAARVAEHPGFDQEDAGESAFDDVHSLVSGKW